MMKPVNEAGTSVSKLVPRDPAKPFVGVINAGNLKGAGNDPLDRQLGACGRNASICASGMFSYFDALAQATANLRPVPVGPEREVAAADRCCRRPPVPRPAPRRQHRDCPGGQEHAGQPRHGRRPAQGDGLAR